MMAYELILGDFFLSAHAVDTWLLIGLSRLPPPYDCNEKIRCTWFVSYNDGRCEQYVSKHPEHVNVFSFEWKVFRA